MSSRRTIAASDNPAVLGGMRAKNNGRYNGNGRHWETPPDLFARLHAEFGFTLDPCATPMTAKCRKFYTEEQNGLEQDWGQQCVFMNPPYGREVYAWTRKARESAERGATVVGLLPASTDLAWWHDDIVGRAEVRYLRGRVRFLTGGPYRASGFFPSVIVVWRPRPPCASGCRPVCKGCHRTKAPVGRSIAPAMAGTCCDYDCAGYYEDPKPCDLWPGEERAPREQNGAEPMSDKCVIANFDGMAWPVTGNPLNGLQWRLRYGDHVDSDTLQAAEVINAYGYLLRMSQRERNEMVKKLRAHAMPADGGTEPSR